jgi:uncharacterized iron-regulated membrane protein
MRKLPMIRRIFVFLHRWVGLLMTAFLVVVGLTGSLLAFGNEIERFVAPQLFATPRPGAQFLDLATLAEKASALAPPNTHLIGVRMNRRDQALANFLPEMKINPETGKPILPTNPQTGEVDFQALRALVPPEILIDPWTGLELARRKRGDLSEGLINLMPFIFGLHFTLQPILPMGTLVLGIVAVLWTIDCFVGFYLTLPVSLGGFWRKWRTAWAIKRGAGAYRLNFDLHRASGLWLWPMLFIFAWSSVMYNMGPVYRWVMPKLFDFSSSLEQRTKMTQRSLEFNPSLDWRSALAVGERLMAEQAAKRDFTIGDPVGLFYRGGSYSYEIRSNLAVSSNYYGARVQFNGDTGAFVSFDAPTGEHTGDTISSWLKALHTASVFGLPYKIFVCAIGLAVTMLSLTGVYIWWKKRQARRFHKTRGASAGVAVEATIVE